MQKQTLTIGNGYLPHCYFEHWYWHRPRIKPSVHPYSTILATRVRSLAFFACQGRTSGFYGISFWAYGCHVSVTTLSGQMHLGPITVSNLPTSIGPKGTQLRPLVARMPLVRSCYGSQQGVSGKIRWEKTVGLGMVSCNPKGGGCGGLSLDCS